jgi:predicted anti-sigma-YlaC factor YlaD
MKCRDARKRLSAYSDGEIRSEERTLIESHVRSCESCRKVLEEIRSLWTLMDALHAAKPSPFLTAKIRNRLRPEERPRRAPWTERLLIPASAVAIALLGFWIGIVAGGSSDTAKTESGSAYTVASASYVDTFDSVPSASFGDVYFTLAGQE